MTDPGDVTRLLAQIGDGDERASAELISLLYTELRRIAAAMMRHERPGHTLQPTAVVHEAFVRLLDNDGVRSACAGHFA